MDFSIDILETDGLRKLRFEAGPVQGAMRIGRPWDLALEYTREMMACLLMREENRFPDDVLLIGLGAGSLAKFLYRNCPLTHVTVVEIDPRVVVAARESFLLPDDPDRLDIVIGDGAAYLQATSETYDLIMVDGFNEYGHPGELNTLPFYKACRSHLGAQGLLVVNLIGISGDLKGGFAHIEAAFDRRAALFPMCKSGNSVAFAATGEGVNLGLDELEQRALALEARTGLALMPTLAKLDQVPACGNGKLIL